MANTEGTATTLTASMEEIFRSRLSGKLPTIITDKLEASQGNRQETIRSPGETQTQEITSNMNTTKTSTKKTSKKTKKPEAQAAKPETVQTPGGGRAIVSSILGQLLAATKTEVATKRPNATPEQQARQVATTMERKVLTLDSVERNGSKQLLLVCPFSQGLLRGCKEANIAREFVSGEGMYFAATDRKALLKVLRGVWQFGRSVLVVDGAEPEVMPDHTAAVEAYKAANPR